VKSNAKEAARKNEFQTQLQADAAVRLVAREDFTFRNSENMHIPPISSRQEGRFARIVTIRGAGCGGRDGVGRFF
jgi:hypothetical protein